MHTFTSLERAHRTPGDNGQNPIIERSADRWGLSIIRKFDLSCNADKVRYVARQRFAFPGGYELFTISSDGDCICQDCVRRRYAAELRNALDGQYMSVDCGGNIDPDTCYCDNCGKDLSSYVD